MIFCFKIIFKEFNEQDLNLYCSHLEVELKYVKQSNIDVNELYLKLNLFEEFVPTETTNPTYVLKYMKKIINFTYAINLYKVSLTILITVA